MRPRSKAPLGEAMSAKKQMRPGPATRAASYVDFRACFSRCAGEMLKVRQRSAAGAPLLPELVADHDFHHRSASTGPAGEAAMPGHPARAHTQSRMSPAIHSRESSACHWLCRNHSASSKSSHVFTADTLRQAGVVRNRKSSSACAEAVNYADYLWKAMEKIG